MALKLQSLRGALGAALLTLMMCVVPALAHHSFAMYDQTKTVTLTGVAYQFVAQANHAEIHFYLIGPDGKLAKEKDGKNVDWGVEMAGAAAVAQQGITAASFPVGTIFSVKLNPLRDGSNFGSRVGAIAKCPWKVPPAAGKTCDTVTGSELLGGTF
jgi:Family of unknown function (DUF6152)